MDKKEIYMNEEFNDTGLQQAYLRAKEISEDYKKNLEKINKDIKNLEKFLQTSGFDTFSHEFMEEPRFYLRWENRRLLYEDAHLSDPKKRPLIECPLQIRTRVHPLLATFLTRISILGKENG